MSLILKITAILIVIAAAVNIFMFMNKDFTKSDVEKIESKLANPSVSKKSEASPSNVSVVDGKQIIAITAKGGYSPKTTTAKADMPTAIVVKTQGTFDCSSALTIPSIGFQKNLPPTGDTMIDIPTQKKGATIQGVCSMGMYNFSIKFE